MTPAADVRASRVCVDLDGVLTQLEGCRNSMLIGEPYPHARRFLQQLAGRARVIIYTSRCGQDVTDQPLALRWAAVKHWLEDHDLPFERVYLGYGKPQAEAYVDDRAVVCRPYEDPRINDFDFALAEVEILLDRREKLRRMSR